MSESECKIRIVLDMSFDSYMDLRTVRKMYQQIQHAYAANRRAQNPMQLFLTSFDGPSRQVFDRVDGTESWDLNLHKEHFEKIFPPESIVYLTSDSDEVLETLEESKIYVIGGLIDHNHHKGLCLSLAEEKGWATARLPIDKFMKMKGRTVLTVNQVLEILTRFSEVNDWQNAFAEVIPQRKMPEEDEESKDNSM